MGSYNFLLPLVYSGGFFENVVIVRHFSEIFYVYASRLARAVFEMNSSIGDDQELSTRTLSDKSVFVTPLRKDYRGPPISVFQSCGLHPKLTDIGRTNIILDSAYLKLLLLEQNQAGKVIRSEEDSFYHNFCVNANNQQYGVPTIIKNHYGIAKVTAASIIRAAETSGRINSAPRIGRPSQFSPNKRLALQKAHNDVKGRTTLRRLNHKMDGQTTWLVTKEGVVHTTPSASTLSRVLNDGNWMIKSLRVRPLIEGNDVAVAERKAFPLAMQDLDDTFVIVHDEAYIGARRTAGKVLVDLKAHEDIVLSSLASTDNHVIREFSGSGHPPQIFLFGAVSKPRTITIEGKVFIHPDFDGKVFLARIRGKKKRKQRRGNHAKGSLRFENITINGPRYKEIFETDNGYLTAIRHYLNPELRPPGYCSARVLCVDLDRENELESMRERGEPMPPARWNAPALETTTVVQEDGAPGHGYDNRNNRGTAVHDDLVHNCASLGIKLIKQSRLSPEINNMDLGVWNIIKSSIENRSTEIPVWNGRNADAIESATWRIAKEEWLAMDPRKLLIISEQRRVMLNEMKRVEGKSIAVEPHTGLRAALLDIQHDPDFVRSFLRSKKS